MIQTVELVVYENGVRRIVGSADVDLERFVLDVTVSAPLAPDYLKQGLDDGSFSIATRRDKKSNKFHPSEVAYIPPPHVKE